MAPKAGTKSVSATISADAYDAIEEYRWSVRKNLSQVVDQAVTEFITAHQIPLAAPVAPEGTDPLPVEGEKVTAGKGGK